MTLSFMSADADLSAFEPFRHEVRAFIGGYDRAERDGWVRSWGGYDRDFTRALGARGWIGMTWPRRYGGGERPAIERFVLLEELLAAGAPVQAHWLADRQVGPLVLALGTEEQKQRLLPPMTRGDLTMSVGLSEPDSGSDLASVRTKGTKVDGGWSVNGRKVWTSKATHAEMMLALIRTGVGSERHAGLSQLLIRLDAPGITIRPIRQLDGGSGFAEVTFDDVFVPDTDVIGVVDEGWRQVTMELGLERSGPERFLGGMRLLGEIVQHLGPQSSQSARAQIGRVVAHLATLRALSVAIALQIGRGEPVNLEGAVVKDLGAVLEQELVELARRLISESGRPASSIFQAHLQFKTLNSPALSIMGGTRQVLRGIIARGMGLR